MLFLSWLVFALFTCFLVGVYLVMAVMAATVLDETEDAERDQYFREQGIGEDK